MNTPNLPGKLDLARIPTPIEPLPNLSREWDVDLRVKRDDMTGVALSGNKIRKLDFLLRDALRRDCDMIVTCGAVTSNHARATAVAARKLGLECLLVLAGPKPEHAVGNLQLDLLVGAQIRYISWEEYGPVIDEYVEQVGEELRSQGKKPYVIPTGGSNALGLLGYVDAAREIKAQTQAMEWRPDYTVCAIGSGGTYAGLYLGNAFYEYTKTVLGILVCASINHFHKKIWEDMQSSVKQYGWTVDLGEHGMMLHEDYIAGGYAKTEPCQLNLIRHAAQAEALILEPVYTGKTFFGLYDLIKKGDIPAGSKVLFIHTGGIFGLSPFSQEMTGHWGSVEQWAD